MRVKEIMTRDIISILPDLDAKEAMEILFKNRISGLPVIDKEKKLLGMFTEKDILKMVLPSYWDKVGRFVYGQDPKAIKKKMAELKNYKVCQVMRKEVVVVDEDTALYEVVRIMLTQKIRRVPVLDKEKKVCGIVAREDILRAFAKQDEG